MPGPSRHLADLTAPDLDGAVGEGSVVVVPVGSVEQHGPHLPFSTDLVIAEAVAEAAVDRAGDELDLWLLPPLAYTKSDEHHWSAGTVWLSTSTFLAVLDDLAASVARLPARRLVFVNGHGGNTAVLGVALRQIRRDHGLLTFLLHPALPAAAGGTSGASELGMGIHAGEEETSLMLHLRPDLVRMERAERHVPEALADNELVRFGGPVAFGWTSDDFGPSGVIGDPTGAAAESGAALLDGIVERTVAALGEIAAFDYERFRA